MKTPPNESRDHHPAAFGGKRRIWALISFRATTARNFSSSAVAASSDFRSIHSSAVWACGRCPPARRPRWQCPHATAPRPSQKYPRPPAFLARHAKKLPHQRQTGVCFHGQAGGLLPGGDRDAQFAAAKHRHHFRADGTFLFPRQGAAVHADPAGRRHNVGWVPPEMAPTLTPGWHGPATDGRRRRRRRAYSFSSKANHPGHFMDGVATRSGRSCGPAICRASPGSTKDFLCGR